jgi:hypothetical protein
MAIPRTMDTTDGFLESAIADKDRFVAPRENIDPMAVIEAALVSCRDQAQEADVELLGQYAADLPRESFTDPVCLSRLLRNLAAFAIEIAERGRVRLSARKNCASLEFNLKVSRPRAKVGVETEDAGRQGGAWAHARLEMVRQDLQTLNGRWHFVKRSAEGLEVSIRLAWGEGFVTG